MITVQIRNSRPLAGKPSGQVAIDMDGSASPPHSPHEQGPHPNGLPRAGLLRVLKRRRRLAPNGGPRLDEPEEAAARPAVEDGFVKVAPAEVVWLEVSSGEGPPESSLQVGKGVLVIILSFPARSLRSECDPLGVASSPVCRCFSPPVQFDSPGSCGASPSLVPPPESRCAPLLQDGALEQLEVAGTTHLSLAPGSPACTAHQVARFQHAGWRARELAAEAGEMHIAFTVEVSRASGDVPADSCHSTGDCSGAWVM